LNRSSVRRLRDVVAGEVERAMQLIRQPGHPRPHYLSCLVRDKRRWRMEACYGSLLTDVEQKRRNCFCDVRVGSYRNDQVADGGLRDNDDGDESYDLVQLPFGDGADGVRHALWRLIDCRYREALADLLDKRSQQIDYVDENAKLPSFEKLDPVVDWRWRELPELVHADWVRFVERASLVPKRYPEIKNSSVSLTVVDRTHVFVSSEGSRILQRRATWQLQCYLWMLTEKGDGLPWTISYFSPDPADLPSAKAFHAEIRRKIGLLNELAAAPTINAYSGPVLLEPGAAGLLVHEALGHRLEGSRLLNSASAQTFRDAVGSPVLPEFLSMYDDPSIERFQDRSLVGHYRYDDEGVAGQRADLIKDGKICGFLSSRAGLARPHRSNGHGRNGHHERPISRMGVTVLETSNGVGDKQLRQALIDEVRRQDLPFGIRIIRAANGETATEAYDFQAFLGSIDLASRVYPDGREELIRGVDFVGTPLNAVRSIQAAGNRYEVDNAYCGAESGWVPVTTISPALLLSHLELQRKAESPMTQFAYPSPWSK
jgi:predicted Zn-dependent protease